MRQQHIVTNETKANPAADFIDGAELRKRFPVCSRTLHNYRTTGKIPFVRVPGGRLVLYHWPSVEAALLRMQQGGPV